jgi:hypothetical protein
VRKPRPGNQNLASLIASDVAVEEAVGLGDRFVDGGGVDVDSKGRTFAAPPELEFEHVHFDEDFLFWIEVLWIGLEPRTCRMADGAAP